MLGTGNDDLNRHLGEELKLTDPARDEFNASLSRILVVAKPLQDVVFPWSPPLAHLILFALSGPMLGIAVTNQIAKQSYKWMLITAVLMGGFALASGYLSVIGAAYAMNGLEGGNMSKEPQPFRDDIFIARPNHLYVVQVAQASTVSLFYLFIGGLFM